MTSKHMKRCSASLITREMQVKTTVRYHLTPVRMAVIKKSTSSSSHPVPPSIRLPALPSLSKSDHFPWAPCCPSCCQVLGCGTSTAWAHARPSKLALLQPHRPWALAGPSSGQEHTQFCPSSSVPAVPQPRAFPHSRIHRFWACQNSPLPGNLPSCPTSPSPQRALSNTAGTEPPGESLCLARTEPWSRQRQPSPLC